MKIVAGQEPRSVKSAAHAAVRSGTRRVGRPRVGQDEAVAERLLTALQACLRESSYLDIGLRSVAARAGTSHTMISYYFLDKDGMLIALVDRMLSALVADLRQLRETIGEQLGNPTGQMLRCIAAHVSQNAEVARLAIAEVERGGSRIGMRVRSRFMPRILVSCHASVRDLIDAGIYRSDLEPFFAVEALTGIATLGQITLPNLPGLGVERDGFRSERWLDFMTAALDSQFRNGSSIGTNG